MQSKNGKEARDYLAKRYKGMDVSDLCTTYANSFWFSRGENFRVFFIWISFFNILNIKSVSYFGHELYHIVRDIMTYVGIKELNDHEAGAYYFSYLFEQSLKKFRGKK